MDEATVTVPEDGAWSEQEIKEYIDKHGDSDDGPDVTVHPGAVLAGIVLTVFAIYGAYIQQIEFTAFTLGLLTVLALGSKYINE
jgi:hypothetical protein